jgi:O-methyltransferase involved in polyketide biosynthesis
MITSVRGAAGRDLRARWYPAERTSYAEQVMPVAAERGEPWLTFVTPGQMSAWLESHGFGMVEHVRQRDSISAALWDRSDSLVPIELSVLARATIVPPHRP